MSSEGRLVVISGPSGVGKTAVTREMLKLPAFERVVTCTTRPPRAGEMDGRDYHFLAEEEFEEGIRNDRFLEHAKVHGHLYGTPRAAVEEPLRRGRSVILNIDVQGAASIRGVLEKSRGPGGCGSGIGKNGVTMVFLLPPSLEELERRLRARGTDTEAQVRTRLKTAKKELEEKDGYDHQVVNGDLTQAVREVLGCVGIRDQSGESSSQA